MKRKSLLICLALLMVFSVVLLAACSGDTSLPRHFTVTFETNADGLNIDDIKVLEGYSIKMDGLDLNAPIHPTVPNAKFRGWYTDGAFTNTWDMATYRVTENMTLYAKWSYPLPQPSEIAVTDEAFSRSIHWIQSNLDSTTTIEVALRKAEIKIETAAGGILFESVTYPDTPAVAVEGSTLIGDDEVTFTLADMPTGGLYEAVVTTVTDGVTQTASIKGLRFKGTGTEEDPYLVYTEADLHYITTRSIDAGVFVELKEDVTLGSIYSEKRNCVFNGTFEGNNKTIQLKNNSGLFYELGEHGVMRNVKFVGAISGSEPSMGVAANYNSGYIYNVESAAVSVMSSGGKVNDFSTLSKGGAGGIVGTNNKSGIITLCKVSSGQANVISGKIGVGGIAGVNYGEISNFNTYASESGTQYHCAAIIGAYNGKEISSTISNSYAGGAVGVNFGTITQVNVAGKINCRRIDLNNSKDTGASNIGGVVGYNATSGVIDQCFFQGMRCVGDTNVGGIAGFNDGQVINCFTGRRIRSPSGTTEAERKFISPVIGSYNVGGIVGKCGEHSQISNVFSTANVWSYGMAGYTVAEKADNAIGVNINQNPRLTSNYLGRTYGQTFSNELVAPQGDNIVIVDVAYRIGSIEHHLLGATLNSEGKNVADTTLIIEYLTLLGGKFGYNNTYGISLLWQSANTRPLSYYTGE